MNASIARSIMVRLESDGCDTLGLKISESWRREPRSRFDALLAGASHLLCVVDQADSEAAWLAYVIGLARGQPSPLALFLLNEEMTVAPWIADIRRFADLDATCAYYLAEEVEWTAKEERRMAKAALLELGISWHAESFAQCVREGDTKAVDLFLSSGFLPDIREKTGVPMLCLAARSRHRGIVELLLDRGAAIDVQSDDRGYSALMDAAQQGDEALVDFLLDRGANPNLQSKDGQTALVLAVGRGDSVMVVKLLASGADTEIADKLGLTARKYAKLFRDPLIDAAFAAIER
ncbi:MAG: ankyrin repeat domain-containing protein [Spirochaetes bacterium]|nr:ankyrin repeat domain-containing protein [Spirochaetota bacterium]MBU1079249.1 ankyrin repeat domain-containing protein [Spirochaetota bacterium]